MNNDSFATLSFLARRVDSAALLAAFCMAFLRPAPVEAGDGWNQWGGAERNFKADADHLAGKWPAEGPKKLWSRELGDGYASIISDGSTLYTMYSRRAKGEDGKHALEGEECVVALAADTGKTLWEHCYDAPWSKEMLREYGPGPHSTPLLVGHRLYTVGCTAKMHCLDKNTGKVLWHKDLIAEHGASAQEYGYGASPLAFKETVILPVGGDGKSVIALNQSDGSLAWKNQSFAATFSSPLLIDLDGETQLVMFTAAEVSGLDPSNGNLLWSVDHKTKYGANIATPVWCRGNILFISSAYGMGSRGIKLKRKDGKTTAKELWHNPKMKIHHGNAVAVGNYVYGSSGDFGPSFFAAIKATTGELAWRERGFAAATCVYGDRKMIILDEDGQLALASVSPKKLKIRSKFQLGDRRAWTVPTIVGHMLYVRDRKVIMALDLG